MHPGGIVHSVRSRHCTADREDGMKKGPVPWITPRDGPFAQLTGWELRVDRLTL